MPPQRVLIIRHGETDYNAQGRWQGQLDIPLNSIGRNQATRLARFLKGRSIAKIYSSPLARAWQTALPVSETLGCELNADVRLSELNAGIFQGLTGADAQTKFAQEWAAYRGKHGFTYCIPKGESLHDLQQRALVAWEDIVQQSPSADVAIVSHGGTIRWLLIGLFGEEVMQDIKLGNTSISTVEWSTRAGNWRLESTGQLAHLND